MAVNFVTLDPYPRSVWRNGAFRGESRLKCKWADRATLISELEGTAWPYPDGPSDALPFEAETFPWGRQLASNSQTTDYEWAIIKVVWRAGGYTPRRINNFRITESFEPTQFSSTIDFRHALAHWTTQERRVEYGEIPAWTQYGLMYSLTVHNVLAVPTAIYDRVGCCNSNAVASYTLNKSFAAETLKYVPPTVKWTFTLARVATYDITYRFDFWPFGWNTHFNPRTAGWEPIRDSDGNRKIFFPPVAYS